MYFDLPFWVKSVTLILSLFWGLNCLYLSLSLFLSSLSLSLSKHTQSSSQHLVLRFLRFLCFLRFLLFLRRWEGQNTYAHYKKS